MNDDHRDDRSDDHRNRKTPRPDSKNAAHTKLEGALHLLQPAYRVDLEGLWTDLRNSEHAIKTAYQALEAAVMATPPDGAAIADARDAVEAAIAKQVALKQQLDTLWAERRDVHGADRN